MIMDNRCFVLLLLVVFFAGCSKSRWDVNVSGSKVNIEIERFENDLFAIPADSIWQKVPVLEKKYDRFFDFFNTQIIRIGGTNQLNYDEKLSSFITDPDILETRKEVQKVFGEPDFVPKLNQAFSHVKYYYPNTIIPRIYTHISGYNQSIVVDSGYMSISLDKYLGVGYKYYQMLRTPAYIERNMHPAKIPSDVMLAYAMTEFEYKPLTDHLLSQMLYYGKIHLFLDAMMPEEPDSLKWGYTQKQLDWCIKNEQKMWLVLVDEKALFSSSYKEINRYINPGPFTPAFPKYSPGGVGQWIGYRIVESYLKKNPQVTLQTLMDENDYQKILNLSKYKP